MQPPVHVCLVSGQLLPNLMPILHFGAAAVHLVVSADMKAQGVRMQRLLAARGVHNVHVEDKVPGTGLPDLIEYAQAVAARLHEQREADSVLLNMTGGTKTMALGFVFGFENALEDFRIVYTDTDHRRFDVLRGNEYVAQPIPEALIDVPTYLEAQGCRIKAIVSDGPEWRARVHGREALTRHLAEYAGELGAKFFPTLNECVQLAFVKEQGRARFQVKPVRRPGIDLANGVVNWAWEEAQRLGLVKEQGNNQVVFPSEDGASYLGGIWLEEYAWLSAQGIGLADVRAGVRFKWDTVRGYSSNEFDLVAIHHNRPLIVECKTVNFTSREKGRDIVYKLDSLAQRFARVIGEKLLLSALPLDRPTLESAAAAGIDVIDGRRVGSLRSRLKALLR